MRSISTLHKKRTNTPLIQPRLSNRVVEKPNALRGGLGWTSSTMHSLGAPSKAFELTRSVGCGFCTVEMRMRM